MKYTVWFVMVLLMALASAGVVVPMEAFVTEHHSVLIRAEISDEIAINLWEGDPENRVWFVDAGGMVIGGNSFFEMTFATRKREKDRLLGFLDSLGVSYRVRTLSTGAEGD